MKNHYQIPIYHSYTEFESNYDSDFKKWLDVYPDGREFDFIAEVERKYSFFFTDIHERVSFIDYIFVHCYKDTKYLYSKNLEMKDWVSVLNFRLKDFIKNNPKTIINNISELSKIEDYILGKNKIDEYDIEYNDFNKYKEFIEVQNNESNFSLVFNYVKFRNFELSVNRIFEWLNKEKDALNSKIEFSKQKQNNTSQPIVKDHQNQHNHIFANNGFKLFEYILENHIKAKEVIGRYADISFYYWKLYNHEPQYIHQRPEVFRNWFCTLYSDDFDKIKALNEVVGKKGDREKHFLTSLEWLKHNP
ncbi:hypothetical protein SAMN05421741_101100 [Paenimyroides ummariense]|uniref:Uncharacterized protein n=1 Tax=Paenimyroides ummariense TaxID=913024 RepID=A0A1I4W7J2_9FLAO|nr:hypothetical protein [Paenimyroides ummariense]SFN09403.1 hypothetical protein SAMN05421741_101100 [Paenimyroides ummariense]